MDEEFGKSQKIALERELMSKKIGGKYGLICAGIGVIIAQSIMTFLASLNGGIIEGFFWFTGINYLLNIVIGILIMFGLAYYLGQTAGKEIIIKKKNPILIGFLTGMIILVSTSFLASWVGFFQEGIDNVGTYDNPFFDYIFKPVYWTTIFGIIPTFIVGIWFGLRIKKEGEKMNTVQNSG
jgi:hypothetical protein